ncbi:MAG: beta-ketoacyl-ACP synthase II [Candidatus Bipolaricaulota bacterium]|nr:MAG: beta-ketoacyl-ACP synthase II [Candidatus Bipolaricaulota bacterium]
MERRVVVTGIGPVTSIGIGGDAFWSGLASGRSGVRRVDDRMDLERIPVKIGAPVDAFDPLEFMDARRARRLDRTSQFALAASALAIADARLEPETFPGERVGVIAGTGIGGLETMGDNLAVLAESGPRRVSPFFVTRLMPNAIAAEISIEHGLRGVNFGVVSACASGAHAVAIGAELVRSGLLDAAIVGGSEAVMLPITYAGFAKIGALSQRNDEPERASRPFDVDRDGFVIGEGAGMLVLEEEGAARKRGARLLVEIAGSGMTADATHITAPAEDGAGAAEAMVLAMRQGGVATADVTYINAHGTSTELNDRAETRAILSALGESDARRLRVNSTKSQIGHLLGAAGAVEAIATILAMEHRLIPATLNHETPDPECTLDYTPEAVEAEVEFAISNSFGFGGQNAAVLFRRVSS